MQIPMILDCTIRDGGYMNDWDFKEPVVRDVYRAVSKAGVDYSELGYHGTNRFFDPSSYGMWRFTPEDALRRVVDGVQGSRIAIMVDFGRYDTDEIPLKADSVVDMVRIAVHGDQIRAAASQASILKEKGYQVSLNLMGYATYSSGYREEIKHILSDVPLDYVYMADSYGSMFPDQIESFLEPLQAIEGMGVGFHPHNNLQMSFANSLEAIRCGVDIIDGSLYGIGRAAGNLPLEALVTYLQAREPERFNVLPLLNVIDRHFLSQQQATPWGYQLQYMLSGLFSVHPNYAQHLVERREYTIEDIWKGLQLVSQSDQVGFSPEFLTGLISKGFMGGSAELSEDKESVTEQREAMVLPTRGPVSYINRHQGRDFLILAAGPTLGTHAESIGEFISRYNPVILGANYLGGLFVPHYHAFNNKRRFIDYVSHTDAGSKLLLGSNFEDDFIREHTARDYECLEFDNKLADFNIVEGVITTNCRTIAVLLGGVAIVMGAQRVFMVGMDGYLGLDTSGQVHFYRETDETSDLEIELEKHRLNYRYLQQISDYAEGMGKEGLHILTPTGYANLYTGIHNYTEGKFTRS